MENLVNNVKNSMQNLKETLANAVSEIKGVIVEKVGFLNTIKQDLTNAFDCLSQVAEITDNMSIEMEIIYENANMILSDVEPLLMTINPDYFEDEDEEDVDLLDYVEDEEEEDIEDEDEDRPYILLETPNGETYKKYIEDEEENN